MNTKTEAELQAENVELREALKDLLNEDTLAETILHARTPDPGFVEQTPSYEKDCKSIADAADNADAALACTSDYAGKVVVDEKEWAQLNALEDYTSTQVALHQDDKGECSCGICCIHARLDSLRGGES